MKIKLVIITALCALLTNFAAAQGAANASFFFANPGTADPTTAGTYSPNTTFQLSIRLNYPGTPPTEIDSLSLFLQVPEAFASFIMITSQTFSDGSPGSPSLFQSNTLDESEFPVAFDLPGDPGRLRTVDLGGTTGGPAITPRAESYYISTLSFQLAADAPLGTFNLQTTNNPPTSVSNNAGNFFTTPQATYAITVVPEPSTWALMGVGALGMIALSRFRRRGRL